MHKFFDERSGLGCVAYAEEREDYSEEMEIYLNAKQGDSCDLNAIVMSKPKFALSEKVQAEIVEDGFSFDGTTVIIPFEKVLAEDPDAADEADTTVGSGTLTSTDPDFISGVSKQISDWAQQLYNQQNGLNLQAPAAQPSVNQNQSGASDPGDEQKS